MSIIVKRLISNPALISNPCPLLFHTFRNALLLIDCICFLLQFVRPVPFRGTMRSPLFYLSNGITNVSPPGIDNPQSVVSAKRSQCSLPVRRHLNFKEILLFISKLPMINEKNAIPGAQIRTSNKKFEMNVSILTLPGKTSLLRSA